MYNNDETLRVNFIFFRTPVMSDHRLPTQVIRHNCCEHDKRPIR